MKGSVEISNDVVFFVHIPKCAGTSFGAFFDKKLRPSGHLFWHGQDGDLNTFAEEKRFLCQGEQGVKFVGGHFTINAARKIIEESNITNPRICSVIRDPIEQAESYFHWITSESLVKEATHPLYEHCKKMSPAEFFNDEVALAEVCNIQSKYLLGLDIGSRENHDVQTLALNLLMQDGLYIADVSQTDSLVAKVDDLLFLNKTDAGSNKVTTRENVSGVRRCEFDEDTLSLIRHRFWADILLYETLRKARSTAINHLFFKSGKDII